METQKPPGEQWFINETYKRELLYAQRSVINKLLNKLFTIYCDMTGNIKVNLTHVIQLQKDTK